MQRRAAAPLWRFFWSPKAAAPATATAHGLGGVKEIQVFFNTRLEAVRHVGSADLDSPRKPPLHFKDSFLAHGESPTGDLVRAYVVFKMCR